MRNTRKSGQILWSKKRPRPTLRSGRGSRTNSNTSHQIPARVIEADTVNVRPVCDVLLVASQSHSLSDRCRKCVQRIMRSSSGSEPIREADEVAFVESIEHHDGRALDDLIQIMIDVADMVRRAPPDVTG